MRPIERQSKLPRNPRRTIMTQHLQLVRNPGMGGEVGEVEQAAGLGNPRRMLSVSIAIRRGI
jgi:hypothetical protein